MILQVLFGNKSSRSACIYRVSCYNAVSYYSLDKDPYNFLLVIDGRHARHRFERWSNILYSRECLVYLFRGYRQLLPTLTPSCFIPRISTLLSSRLPLLIVGHYRTRPSSRDPERRTCSFNS